jgi:hypothetical protein
VKCLQFLAEGHSVEELQQAIREKDLLGKRTREARRTYWRLISWRYLTPPESVVTRALAALSCRGADDPVLRKVGQLFLADIGRDINPVIKVADYTEAELQSELEDYVVTDVIEKDLLDFLDHYTETRQKQTDRVGVWISGYVGAGKSHFAKLLGLLTANPQVAGRGAIDRFRPRLATCRQAREIERYLYEGATFLHTEVIGFQIDAVAIKGQQDDICNILYRQFLAHRGLSTDLKIALMIEEPLIERAAFDVYRQSVQELAKALGRYPSTADALLGRDLREPCPHTTGSLQERRSGA